MTIQRIIDDADEWILDLEADARVFITGFVTFMSFTITGLGVGCLYMKDVNAWTPMGMFVIAVVLMIAALAIAQKIHDEELEDFKKGAVVLTVVLTAMTAIMIPSNIVEFGILLGCIVSLGPILGLLNSATYYTAARRKLKARECHQ